MQGDVELGLGDNEKIIAIGDKNHVFFVCGTALFLVFAVALLFLFFVITSVTKIEILTRGFILAFSIFFFWFTKFLYNSYQYNQIYITDKRIIITQKDRIEGIPFDEVQYINSADLDFSTLNLKSKRKIFFAYTNLKEVEKSFITLYPFYKRPKLTLRQFLMVSFAVLIAVILNVPEKYIESIQKHLPYYTPKSEETILITDSKSYMEYMQKTLKFNWNPPKLENNAKVIVEFKIKPDGTIYDEKIMETSGSRELDNSALFAIRSANPLKNLPDDLENEEEIKINFTFDYNVFKQNN